MAKIEVTDDGETVVVGDNDQIDIEIDGGGTVIVEADPDDDVDKFTVDFLDDTESDRLVVKLSTFSQDGLEINIKKYDPSDEIVLEGAFDTFVDPDDPDEFTFKYIGSDGATYTGLIRAKDGGEKDFTDPTMPINIICFGDGTMIDTPRGRVKVEDLRPGDTVMTLDNGPQPLRWTGRRVVSAKTLGLSPWLGPVVIPAGTFGCSVPDQDLILSPNHRVMLLNWRAEILFGQAEVLAAAKYLDGLGAISTCRPGDPVAYNHLLFDRHEIVLANGLPCESLYPGPVALGALDDGALAEIRAIFPEVMDPDSDHGPPARRILRGFEAAMLVREIDEASKAA